MAALDAFYNIDLDRFYKIYVTVHEMVNDRGYIPLEPQLSKNEWISHFLGYLAELENEKIGKTPFEIIDTLSLIFKKGIKQLLVYFYPLDSKLCQNDMDYIHNLMKQKGARHLIIIANNKATPKVANVFGILGHRAQFFSENEMLFNVTKHQLVPKHRCLIGEEKEKILNCFGRLSGDNKIHLEIFPGIFTNDPVVKYYNFKVDDLIQIERPRKDGFFDISYRVVIHPITDKDKKTGY